MKLFLEEKNAKHLTRHFLLPIIELVIALIAGCGITAANPVEVDVETWQKFEGKLDYLRQQMKIPGMSAAVVMNQKLAWAKGFGYADLEKQVKATPDTPYFNKPIFIQEGQI